MPTIGRLRFSGAGIVPIVSSTFSPPRLTVMVTFSPGFRLPISFRTWSVVRTGTPSTATITSPSWSFPAAGASDATPMTRAPVGVATTL